MIAAAGPDASRVFTRAQVLAGGLTAWQLRRAVAEGTLVRLRRDRYTAAPDERADIAVRIGGRLSCVSLLARRGVFVYDDSTLHIQVPRTGSRLRSETGARSRWDRQEGRRRGIRLHWCDHVQPPPSEDLVDVLDAIRLAVLCQAPRHAIATLDSVLHIGLVSGASLLDLFRTLPSRYHALLPLIDARSEAGTESLVRLILRQIGCRFAVQVSIAGVGRVDFVVDGWLIIECDSRAHHEGWQKQVDDRRRDLAAARLGYTTVRLLAAEILYRPGEVHAALREVLRAHECGGA